MPGPAVVDKTGEESISFPGQEWAGFRVPEGEIPVIHQGQILLWDQGHERFTGKTTRAWNAALRGAGAYDHVLSHVQAAFTAPRTH